ncbi:hypothetical protein H4R24_003684 [Coemansia sp. RSA 988]|nr:hypothetical protein H4R24_003684 [Coemansia sp. RSA 988]
MSNIDTRSVARFVEDAVHAAMPHRLYTLIFPIDRPNGKVLLGMKKRGFGQGKLNGFGGKVEPSESIEQGAVRELEEESGLCATRVENCGLLLFYFEDNPVAMEVHVFMAHEYNGQVAETEEMRPEWFDFDNMPFSQMWADDKCWWPLARNGRSFIGRFWFKADQVTITRQTLDPVSSLDFERYTRNIS